MYLISDFLFCIESYQLLNQFSYAFNFEYFQHSIQVGVPKQWMFMFWGGALAVQSYFIYQQVRSFFSKVYLNIHFSGSLNLTCIYCSISSLSFPPIIESEIPNFFIYALQKYRMSSGETLKLKSATRSLDINTSAIVQLKY